MRIRIPLASLLLAALVACTPSATVSTRAAAPPLGADSVRTQRYADGVLHRRLVVLREPWIIQVVEVDLRRPELSVRAEHAFGRLEGRERTSAIARRVAGDSLDVVVAVNADFFSLRTGEATNNQVVEGRLVTGIARAGYGARPVRSHFAVDACGRPIIERFTLQGAVHLRDDSLPLAGINLPPVNHALVLRRWPAPDTLPADSVGDVRALALLAVGNDTVKYVPSGAPVEAKAARLPSGGALLVARGSAVESLERIARSRDTVRVTSSLAPAHGALRTVVGGWARLVADGVVVGDTATEGAAKSFLESRHPRTAVGYSRDGNTLYLVVVDGRQQRSAGMTIAELARTMRALGAWNAVNLDGGGSTTLVVRDSILNSPSDAGGERTVGNALLVVRPRP